MSIELMVPSPTTLPLQSAALPNRSVPFCFWLSVSLVITHPQSSGDGQSYSSCERFSVPNVEALAISRHSQ